MDGVEILGTMAAENIPWWVFLGLVLIGMMFLGLIIFADTDHADVAYYTFLAMLVSFLLGVLTMLKTPERQIAMITDKASYVAVEAQYKVTKIDEHLYFLEMKDGGGK